MNLKQKLSVIALFVLFFAFASCALAEKNDKAEKNAKDSKNAIASKNAKEGLDFYKNGDCKNAIESLNKAATDLPKNAEIHYSLALAYKMCGDLTNAIKNMEEAIEFKKNEFNYHKFLGRLFYENKQYDNAIFQLETANKLKPSDFMINLTLSMIYSKKEDYKNAIQYLEQVLKSKPKHKMANFMMGSAYYKLGNYQKAAEYFQKETNNFPDDYKSFYHLAIAYKDLKQYDKALAALEKALEIKKNDIELYDFYIRVAFASGLKDKALEYCEKGKANCPSVAKKKDQQDKFQFFLGWYYYDKESFEKTINILENINPKNLNKVDRQNLDARLCHSYVKVAYMIYQKGDFEKSLGIYKKALERCPDNQDAQKGLDSCQKQLEKKKTIEEELKKEALEETPGEEETEESPQEGTTPEGGQGSTGN